VIAEEVWQKGEAKVEKKDALFCILKGVKLSLGIIVSGHWKLKLVDRFTYT